VTCIHGPLEANSWANSRIFRVPMKVVAGGSERRSRWHVQENSGIALVLREVD